MSGTFFPVDQRTLQGAVEMRAVLPKLAKASRRWSSARVCPQCLEIKSDGAKTCHRCYERRRDAAKALESRPHPGDYGIQTAITGSLHGPGRGRGRTGVPVDQPQRPRMRKTADGRWEIVP